MDCGPQLKAETSGNPAQIVELLPVVTGVYLILHCQVCDRTFSSYQTTVACMAIGQCTCPQCQAVYEVWPEDFIAALNRHRPPLHMEDLDRITAESTRIAETWYQVGPLAQLLNYKGVNLGESAERFLASFISQGLYISYCRRKTHA